MKDLTGLESHVTMVVGGRRHLEQARQSGSAGMNPVGMDMMIEPTPTPTTNLDTLFFDRPGKAQPMALRGG